MKIGYACQAIGVAGTSFKRCLMKNATTETLLSLISQNLTALDHIIDYNIQNHIKLFRITSDLIPFGSSPVNQLEWSHIFHNELQAIGKKTIDNGIRISMHPGQYTVLNSPDEQIVKRAVLDLTYHCKLLEAINDSQENKLILHIGGAYGNKKQAMDRFVDNYHKLSPSFQKHLVIENDDKTYNIAEVMEISKLTGAPVVFDVLHHQINPGMDKKRCNCEGAKQLQSDIYDWIAHSNKTWKTADGNQKIHYSEQDPKKIPGSHSETITLETFKKFLTGLQGMAPDIMLEVKDKNLSVIKCLNYINNLTVQPVDKSLTIMHTST